MTLMPGRRAALALAVSALLFGACTATSPSASPVGSSPAATTSAVPGSTDTTPTPATPSPTPAPTPSPTPTATPAPPAGPLTVTWHRAADPATPKAGDWEDLDGTQNVPWTKLGDLYVLPLNTENSGKAAQVWISSDALHWTRQTLPSDTGETLSVGAVTVGGPGLVAFGKNMSGDSPTDAFWTSVDGRDWSRVATSGLTPGQDWLLKATADGHVSFNASPVDVTTYDGLLNDTYDFRTIVDDAGALTAFETAPDNSHPVGIWQASGSAAWRRVGDLPSSNGGTVLQAVHGPRGWYASGCGVDCAKGLAWISSNGLTWQGAKVPQLALEQGLIADAAGYIAVGARITGLGCAVGSGEIYGETWTSSDGRTWRRMPDQSSFNHASIHALFLSGRTLYGLGLTWPADGSPKSTAWSATLPDDSSVDVSPTPKPSAPPKNQGCGD